MFISASSHVFPNVPNGPQSGLLVIRSLHNKSSQETAKDSITPKDDSGSDFLGLDSNFCQSDTILDES